MIAMLRQLRTGYKKAERPIHRWLRKRGWTVKELPHCRKGGKVKAGMHKLIILMNRLLKNHNFQLAG
jgi:hypothetical protein